MTTEPPLEAVDLAGLSALRRAGEGSGGPAVVLLHGYGGDERAMWVFSSAIPPRLTVVALRGIHPAEDAGYRWHTGVRWPPPEADVFREAVEAIRRAIRGMPSIVWVGFSQGAALALCCAAAGLPGRGVACLAGYLPRALRPLPRGTPVFWSHGAQDERIPIGTARHGADQLRSSGALVDFCETQGGHKVGVECLRALRGWFVGLASDR